MKLDTEEQVYKALWELEHPFSDGKEIDKIVSKLIPIELPSDEDVINKADSVYSRTDGGNTWVLRILDKRNGFNNGAKWIIEQIKQQSNGN